MLVISCSLNFVKGSQSNFPIYSSGVSFCVAAALKVSIMFSVFVEISRASFLLYYLIVCDFVTTFAVLAGGLFGAADKIHVIFMRQQIFANAFNSGHNCFFFFA